MNATLINPESFASKFTHHTANINGVGLHYVRGGQGEPIILLPGWPQTWYAWRYIMPMLAEHYTVIAVDMRGLGDSDKPKSGYDTQTVAKEIYGLIDYLNFKHIFLVGHDVGAWVAYAYAAAYPENVSQLVVLDAAIPGISPDEAFQLSADSKTWQFVFHAVPDVPEMLTAGREKLYLSWFFQNKAAVSGAISDADIDEYVRCYSAPEAMQAGFAYYRAFFCDRTQNQEYAKTKLKMPVLALGGEKAVGMRMLQTMQLVAQNVSGGIVEGCGHYISEECPDDLTAQLLSFFSQEKA